MQEQLLFVYDGHGRDRGIVNHGTVIARRATLLGGDSRSRRPFEEQFSSESQVFFHFYQIIDKYHEMDSIEEPSSALLRVFYRMAKKINTSLWARTSIFSILAALVVVGAVLDLVLLCTYLAFLHLSRTIHLIFLQTTASCLAENPKVGVTAHMLVSIY